MRVGRRRRKARDLARRAAEHAHPRPAPAPTIHEMACICGQLLRLSSVLDEERCACPVCGRKFLVCFVSDPSTGAQVLTPVYVDDWHKSGDTYVADLVSKSQAPPSAKGALDDALEPQPPPQLSFPCPCGSELVAKRELYDRRVRCPKCGVRMLISVAYDPSAKRFAVHPVRLQDGPSGDTWTAEQ